MQIENLPPVGSKIIIRCAGEDHEVVVREGGLFDFGEGTELTCVREDFEGWRYPDEKPDNDGWRAL